MRLAFSTSLLRAKSSKLAQIFTSLFLEKNPDPSVAWFPVPTFKNDLDDNRGLGLGIKRRLNDGNMFAGIEARDAAVGAGWGGIEVGGKGSVGLKIAWISNPSS